MKRIVNGEWIDAPTGVTGAPGERHGVFETLRLRDGTPDFWADHWTRFEAGCHAFSIEPPLGSEALRAACLELANANALNNGVVRYEAVHHSDGRVTWSVDATPPRPHMAKLEFAVTFAGPLPAAEPISRFKHLNRQTWLGFLETARHGGYDEVLLTDTTGTVVEGGVSNVFFVRDGALHTPRLETGALPGIARAAVLALARANDIPVAESEFQAGEAETADELWLTNSLIGIRPVARLEQRPLSSARPVLDRLRVAWMNRYGWDPAGNG